MMEIRRRYIVSSFHNQNSLLQVSATPYGDSDLLLQVFESEEV